MRLKNKQIINIYENLKTSFNDNTKYFPAKINFLIQKNGLILREVVEMIYDCRDRIIKEYGVVDSQDSEQYIIKEQYRDSAQKELDELLDLEQDISLFKIPFTNIENLEFTSNQMEAIMFMIEEENQEDQVE